MPPTPHLSKTVRRLLKLALGLLVLAALFSGFRLWLDAKGRAVLAQLPPRRAPAKPEMPPQKAPAGVAMSGLPVFAGIYGDDPATRAECEALQIELAFLREHLRMAGSPVNFMTLLKLLKIPVPQGMTPTQAATEFLKYAEKFGPFLAGLRESMAAGPWDEGGDLNHDDAASAAKALHFHDLIQNTAWLLDTMVQANLLSNRPEQALALWQDMAQLALRMPDQSGFMGLQQAANLRKFALAAAGRGIGDGGWRDADLAVVSRELERLDPLEAYRKGIQVEREAMLKYLADISKRPRVLWPGQSDSTLPAGAQVQEMLRSLSFVFVSDTQIAANAAIVDRRYQLMEDSFNYRDRIYTPPAKEDTTIFGPTQDSRNGDPFSQWYFMFSDRMTLPDQSTAPVREQTSLDLTRIALALETQKRATGSYPDSLDAVAASFPGGLPHDIATGQSYHYEKTPDGFFRIWGTGTDRIDNGGNPSKDTLLNLPKLR